MTTTIRSWRLLIRIIFALTLGIIFLGSCKKHENQEDKSHQASSFNSEVLDKWMTLQLRLMRNSTGIANQAFSRPFAYSGIAAVESLAPGIPGIASWRTKWNGLTDLPSAGNPKDYYCPANINAAMAAINKAFFPNASSADKAAIDSLEFALNLDFLVTQPSYKIEVSAQFGKRVAAAVFNWSETDGYKTANAPYTIPTGEGLWKPTAPAFAIPSTPYWGNNRTVITGSTVNTFPGAPISYSADPASSFYQMAKQVYDVSQVLTDNQKAMATFWRDVPGVSSPGHWLSILQQVIRHKKTTLDESALAYALTGAAINDALIGCFKIKYQYNLIRPITYIREIMGFNSWSPYLGTPAHPEYISAHSSLSAAAATVLQDRFGDSGTFIDRTYDYMGLTPRAYNSFMSIADEAGISRLYAGIHYLPGISAGLVQGKKVAANVLSDKK